MRELVAAIERPRDIEDEDAMGFFGGRGRWRRESGIHRFMQKPGLKPRHTSTSCLGDPAAGTDCFSHTVFTVGIFSGNTAEIACLRLARRG